MSQRTFEDGMLHSQHKSNVYKLLCSAVTSIPCKIGDILYTKMKFTFEEISYLRNRLSSNYCFRFSLIGKFDISSTSEILIFAHPFGTFCWILGNGS